MFVLWIVECVDVYFDVLFEGCDEFGYMYVGIVVYCGWIFFGDYFNLYV